MFNTKVGIADITNEMGLNEKEIREVQKLTTGYLMMLADAGQKSEWGFEEPIPATVSEYTSSKESFLKTLNDSSSSALRTFIKFFAIENNKLLR